MLGRFWTWTSSTPPANPAVTGVPIGPLRFRQWTSGDEVPELEPQEQPSGGRARIWGRLWSVREEPPPEVKRVVEQAVERAAESVVERPEVLRNVRRQALAALRAELEREESRKRAAALAQRYVDLVIALIDLREAARIEAEALRQQERIELERVAAEFAAAEQQRIRNDNAIRVLLLMTLQ